MPNNVSKLRGANAGQQSEVAQHTRGHCSPTLKPGQVTLDFSSETGTGCQLTSLLSPKLAQPWAGPSLGSAPPIPFLLWGRYQRQGWGFQKVLGWMPSFLCCSPPGPLLSEAQTWWGESRSQSTCSAGAWALLRLPDMLHWPESLCFPEDPGS